VFTSLALVEHGADAYNLHHWAIDEPHGPNSSAVDAGECCPTPWHMVQGTSVQHPMARILLPLITNRNKTFSSMMCMTLFALPGLLMMLY
jgi:hypothetical protein